MTAHVERKDAITWLNRYNRADEAYTRDIVGAIPGLSLDYYAAWVGGKEVNYEIADVPFAE